ncbi:hypothetical protein HMPREF1301_00231 [Propionibacterium sp. KPL2005]|nr:hypothetical protein HMPREF1301_00231 [Propionibacterium sp. KPL2005]ERS26745.1 hypothetical protein HMPREF1297_02335 [Propionibacterium sp. KPL2000]
MADIESILVAALTNLVGVAVSTERPVGMANAASMGHVQVRASGGPTTRSHVIDERHVTLTASAGKSVDAAVLADRVKREVDGLAGRAFLDTFIVDAKCASPAWFPDEDGIPRYFLTATITIQR